MPKLRMAAAAPRPRPKLAGLPDPGWGQEPWTCFALTQGHSALCSRGFSGPLSWSCAVSSLRSLLTRPGLGSRAVKGPRAPPECEGQARQRERVCGPCCWEAGSALTAPEACTTLFPVNNSLAQNCFLLYSSPAVKLSHPPPGPESRIMCVCMCVYFLLVLFL